MNERQRLQYLEAIGIDTYMPRLNLPNAPQSVLCAVPVVQDSISSANDSAPKLAQIATATVASEPALVEPVAAVVSPENILAEVMSATSQLAEAEKPKHTESKTVETPVDQEAVEFALSSWRVSDDLLVVDSRHSELALPTEPLLLNILRALGRPVGALPGAEVVRWPVLDDPMEPRHQEAARHMLEAMLDGMMMKQQAKFILLLGADACHYALPEDRVQDSATADASLESLMGQALNLDSFKVTAIVAPSLSDMLQEPALKAKTWQAIQPLRIR